MSKRARRKGSLTQLPSKVSSVNESARIVIIGGGVIGLAVAYHLAELGISGRDPARAQSARERDLLARGRHRGTAARKPQSHPAGAICNRAVPTPRSADGPVARLPADGRPLARAPSREDDGAETHRPDRADVRLDRHHDRSCGGRRTGGRAFPSMASRARYGSRRTARPIPSISAPLTQSEPGWPACAFGRIPPVPGSSRQAWPHRWSEARLRRRDRLRDRGELCGRLGATRRRASRRTRPAAGGCAYVCRDGADKDAPGPVSDRPRPRRGHLSQSRYGQARARRIRAQRQALRCQTTSGRRAAVP